MISLINNSISVLMWICPQKLFFESSFNSPLKFDVHLFGFFQLLPCFVLLFYHSGLIIICNTVTFSLNRVFSVKKRDKQTKRNLFFYLWWVSSRWIMSIRLNWIIDWTIFGITIISSYFIFSNSSICVPFSNGFRLSISKVTTWGLSNSYTKIGKKAVNELTYPRSICSWVILWYQKSEWTVTLEVEMLNQK